MIPDYPKTGYPTPGEFSHIARECSLHGDQSVFARPVGSSVPFLCVKCCLLALEESLASGED